MPTKKHEIRILRIAEDDLNEIISYISDKNPVAANKLLDHIENDLRLLSLNPFLGRIPHDEDIKKMGYRYLIIENYLIFYTIEDKKIFIHRILHGARDYKSVL
jgi:toxin ParE1/3/4